MISTLRMKFIIRYNISGLREKNQDAIKTPVV